MYKRLVNYHALMLFYSDPEAFSAFAKARGIAVIIESQEYQDLIYGTNANIYVPLWASACKGRGDVLMNQDTLEVIKRYKAFGYEPAGMDGNPPDYIGEQLRFLEHLTAWTVNGSLEEEKVKEVEEEIESFTRDFLLDTIRPTAEGIEKYHLNSLAPIAELIRGLMKEEWIDFSVSEEEIHSWSSWSSKPGQAMDIEAHHKVSVASFSDCGNKCKMFANVQESCVLSMEPDAEGTPIRFTGCPRGMAYPYTFLSSKRLRYPMERIGERGEGRFRRITWDEAADKVANILKIAKEKYGVGSRFVISCSGNCAALRGDAFMKSLLNLDGGRTDFYNFYSAGAAVYVLPFMLGEGGWGNQLSTYEKSKLIILWGINPTDGHFGHDLKATISKAKENGAEIISIDPINHDGSMSMADKWIPIKPSSDAALIDAMCYVIMRDGLEDREFIDKYCIGFDEEHMPAGVPKGESYRSYLFGLKDGLEKTPKWAERITGIPAETIEDLAIKYATVKPAALLPGLGPQRTMRGEQVVRGHVALACLTGNIRLEGGSTGTFPSWKHGGGIPEYIPEPNPYPGAIPLFQWTRAIDKPETMNGRTGLKGVEKMDHGIKALFSLGSGILLNQHSNINDTIRILKDESKLESLVVSDLVMAPSCRFADLLLPGVSFFELDNIMGPWSGDRYFLFNNKVMAPLFGCRFELDWERKVAERLGLLEQLDQGHKSNEEWLEALYNKVREREPELPAYEEFKNRSYAYYEDKREKLAYGKQFKDEEPFTTPSGKIEIFSKALYDMNRPEDIPGIPRYIQMKDGPEDERLNQGKLQLISYHTKKRCHSQHDQNVLLYELDPNRIWINPADAEARGIKDGDMVEAFNEYGVIRLPAKVTDRVAKGTTCLSEGGWFTPAEDGADIGGSINVLTSSNEATPLANSNPQQTNIADVRLVK